ncbi:MAG: 30S ribosomal protein S20 [Phycisphaerales bacterium]|nr:30S ribosomal protein S20 [Phycisphaerales bacterium]
MAHSLSAKKRIRQNSAARKRNVSAKSALKTQIRKFEDALKANDLATAETQLRTVTKKIDQTASTSVMHKNAAARRKSRLAKKLNAARAAKG